MFYALAALAMFLLIWQWATDRRDRDRAQIRSSRCRACYMAQHRKRFDRRRMFRVDRMLDDHILNIAVPNRYNLPCLLDLDAVAMLSLPGTFILH